MNKKNVLTVKNLNKVYSKNGSKQTHAIISKKLVTLKKDVPVKNKIEEFKQKLCMSLQIKKLILTTTLSSL